MEKVGGRVCIFMWKERPSMFGVMSGFYKLICFIISMNIRVGTNFVYGENMSLLLQHLDYL